MAVTVHDLDERQRLLDRIRNLQANINRYVRKREFIRTLVVNISIASSAIAAAIMVGPGLIGDPFVESAANGLGFAKDTNLWRLLCFTSLVVNLIAAISAALTKSDDTTERVIVAEACNAALEQLATDIEFSKLSVNLAGAEYGKIASKILYVLADSPDETHQEQSPSLIVDWYRRAAEVVMPGMAIVFGCAVLVATMVGLSQGAAAAPPTPQLSLSVSQVGGGETYFATASGFLPGEVVQFSWVGPTSGTMASAPLADSGGTTINGPVVESDPPGTYTLTARGQRSGRAASAQLQVVSR